jgi:hypothetical protein
MDLSGRVVDRTLYIVLESKLDRIHVDAPA